MRILLIDDEASLRRTLRIALESMEHSVAEASTSDQVLDLLGHRQFDAAFLDLRLGQDKGLDLLPSLLQLSPGLPVIIITAYATIETAVEAMRRGAADYLPKPFTPEGIRFQLDRVTRLRRLQSHVEELEEQVLRRRPRSRPVHARASDAAGVGHRVQGGRQRCDGAPFRRKRDRQGDFCQGDPCSQPVRRWSLLDGALPEPIGRVAGE